MSSAERWRQWVLGFRLQFFAQFWSRQVRVRAHLHPTAGQEPQVAESVPEYTDKSQGRALTLGAFYE